MPWNEEEDTTISKVVVNHEEPDSLWPAERENPPGWRNGRRGLKPTCLAYIRGIWIDLRSLNPSERIEEID